MILYLESSTCDSGADRNLVTEAARFSGFPATSRTHVPRYPYECAGCDDTFRFVSGFLQHLESGRCRDTLVTSKPVFMFLLAPVMKV